MYIKNYSSYYYIAFFLFTVFVIRAFLWQSAGLDLSFDEAQYWTWSLNPAWGYYSKPPFLSWLIKGFTSLCGDSEFCIRMGSPVLHSLSAFFIALTACNFNRNKHTKFIGFIAASIWILIPGISLSSGFISTDVPLLFFTSLVLWSFSKILLNEKKFIYYLIFCLALSLGFLSKYAIIYFIIGITLAVIIDRSIYKNIRNSFSKISLILIFFGFIIIIFQHLNWNYNNSFITAQHTLSNANIGGEGNSFKNLFKFFFEQFFVFGPLSFLLLIITLFKYKRVSPEEKILIFLTFTPLILVIFQAFISRAHANWGAIAYVPGTVLVALQIVKFWEEKRKIYFGIISVGIAFMLLIPLSGVYNFGIDPYKKNRGWADLGLEISNVYVSYPNAVLVTDDRRVMAEALYYMKNKPKKWVRWNADGYIHDHYELVTKHNDLKSEIGLMVSSEPNNDHFVLSFEKVTLLKSLYRIESKDKNITYKVWLLEGYKTK
jgi:4-amino-4-deoxy-L-arabinose transferase-like glycosyltransferase